MPGRHSDPRDTTFDPHETFHTRATPPRLPALGLFEEDEYPPRTSSQANCWFIAGPARPKRQQNERRSTHLRVKLMARLAILPLALTLLWGAQGIISHLTSDCAATQTYQKQQNCMALSIFTALSGAQAIMPPATPASPTATRPQVPMVPNDLPTNVHDFVVIALPFALQAHQLLAWPTSMVLAQWGLEHGWTVPDANGYNWGNTTFAPNCQYRGSAFCYAPTMAEGLREYVYTARLSYYAGVAPAAKQGGADAAAQELGRSPWDAGHYASMGAQGSLLLAIMRDFNFYRFDVGG